MAQLHVSAGDVPLRCITQGAPPFVGPLPPLELVASRPGLGNLAHLRFFDPAHFRAGLAIFITSRPFGRAFLINRPVLKLTFWRLSKMEFASTDFSGLLGGISRDRRTTPNILLQ